MMLLRIGLTRGPLRLPQADWRRLIYSTDGIFDSHLKEDTVRLVEKYWKPRLAATIPKAAPGKPKYYVLSMFPYPSGKLHMGHVRVYSLSDTFAHYYRMRGYNVIHPMGWDAFGLPAENAAIENKVSPETWTKQNIGKMKEQLSELGCIFDWERELATCDPAYYRWTQWIFLRMYEEGLVYQKDSVVNWDPVDQTVLADEQVDSDGRSWRSGAKVEKRPLKQWFFRTTNFCQSLLDGLKDPILVNWRDIVKAQENWIGKCRGTRIDWKIVGEEGISETLTLWTDVPEFIYATQFIGIHPDHILNSKYPKAKLKAVNPFSGDEVPVIVTSYLRYAYGSQTVHGVPSCRQEQAEFAAQYGISGDKQFVTVAGDRVSLCNSGPLSGLSLEEGRERVMQMAREQRIGGYPTSSNLQDWLISRQRYWGTPIPVVHCPSCGTVPVPESQLPVKLPHLEGISAKGMSPLLAAEDWINTPCPSCGQLAKRETDTMDTFVDSSWYFMRYLDPNNSEAPFSQEAIQNMPVDLYIGGKEHAYLHLYFARFFTHFLHSINLVPLREPFSGLITQGMVKGKSYRIKGSTKYIRPDEAREEGDNKYVEISTGKPLVVEWEKMSKSKYNGVDPSELIEKYGCDTVRLMMLSSVGPSTERNWSEDSYPGVRNLQIKLWKLVYQALDLPLQTLPELRYDEELNDYRNKLREAKNYNLKHVNFNYSFTRNVAVVIARVHSMVGAIWSTPGQVKRDAPEYQQLLGTILILLAPVAPHLMSELWAAFRTVPVKLCDGFLWEKGVFEQPWPQVDPTYNLDLVILGCGKELARLPVARWKFDLLTEDEAFDLACHVQEVQQNVLPHEIRGKQFIKHEGFEASLNLDFEIVATETVSQLSAEELKLRRQQEKEARKLEKEAKKAARAKRIQELEENVRRKATKSFPKAKQG